jgi:hypothetical protein
MNRLKTLTLTDVRSIWETIKPAIEHVQKTCSRGWRTEDVYAALVYDKAALYVCSEDDTKQTLFVLQIKTNEYTLKRSLFIWIGHAHNTLDRITHLADLKTIAMENGCDIIEMNSPRLGWERCEELKRVASDFIIEV